MSARATTALLRAVADSPAEQPPAFSLANLVAVLVDRAGPALTAADLKWIDTGALELAWRMSRSAEALCEGAGMLVGSDTDANTGSFRTPEDASRLLFHLAGSFETIGLLIKLQLDVADAMAGAGGDHA